MTPYTENETRTLNEALRKMCEGTVDLLGDVVEGRDPESGEHVRRVKSYTWILANEVMRELPEYGLDKYTIELITFTSSLHDVGKIAISDSVLLKPGRLTPEEFEIMKTHCVRGCEIIGKMRGHWTAEYITMGMDICRYHHEKWDGRGYPEGLKGDEIPISAQIVSVADIYDALTSKRVYKDAVPADVAFDMILRGECGAFSEKLMRCLTRCRADFEACASGRMFSPDEIEYELVSRNRPEDSFVVGLHDQDRTLREKIRLGEELSVFQSLSEEFCYVCYVNTKHNQITRFRADEEFTRILDSYGESMKSYERFDLLLNSIIVRDDYDAFRKATKREDAMALIQKEGRMTTDFRIRLSDGVHYCRMKITLDPNNPDAVIIGIAKRDEEHRMEMEYMKLQQSLEDAKKEIEMKDKLNERLSVIEILSNEYDYVCSLNAQTMAVEVYRAAPWIRDMFKNLEDLIVSPDVRDSTLRGVIHPDDFDRFQEGSRHENVMKGLIAGKLRYKVSYRAYRYGRLVNYETQYTLDRNDHTRIIIGLREVHG